jgi:coenzyme PQQ precursor peptide PqqA
VNHEDPLPASARLGEDEPAGPSGPACTAKRPEELEMKWETPQAIDLRFGMEITMYIAHR